MKRLVSLAMVIPVLPMAGCGVPMQQAVQRGAGLSATGDYRVTRDIIYSPEDWPEKLRGDLYQPRKTGNSPAVLLIHGGGWSGGDGRWQMEPIAKQLARRGYVVMNVTYRQAPAWIYPAPLEDMGQALRWMRRHAGENGIDTERMGAFGYSAGGYLASLAGSDRREGLKAVVAGGMPSNLAFYPGGDLIPQFLGGRRDEIPEVFREASPVSHVTPDSPPIFLYHGDADRLVPPEHAEAMLKVLEKNKVPHEIHWVRGKGHIRAFLFPGDVVNRAIAFLDGRLR